MPSAYSDSPSPSVSPSSSATSANSPSAATSLAASAGIGSAPSFRGVRKRSWGKWVAEIREPRKRSRIWLGSYFSAQAAARAFDVAAYCLRGPAARMNLPDTLPSAVKDLPPLSPKSVQRVALAAGSTADSCVREMGPTSRYLSSAPASSGHNDTLRASTSLEVLAPSSFPGSVAGASKSETNEVRTAACNLDVRYNAHSQDFQLTSEVAPQIGSVAKPSIYSNLSGRRAEPFPKPPRLTIAAGVEQRNSKGGAIGFITSDAWQCTSTNAPQKICWRDQSTTAAAAAKGGGSPKTLWQANHAGDLSSSLLETGAGFSWLDRAKLEISPKPTIEQIAHAMLLVPPAPATNSQEPQQQQLQSGSAAGCVAHQQLLLQTDSCSECLGDVNDDEHMSEESLWNLF